MAALVKPSLCSISPSPHINLDSMGMRSHSVNEQPINPFLQLPAEIIQQIAYLLPSNADIIRLARCSSDLAARILPAESHIWRRLFQDEYDNFPRRSSVGYRVDYQIRRIVLSQPVEFGHGQKQKQTYWLRLMSDLFDEGTILCRGSLHHGKNLELIRKMLNGSDFQNRPLSGYKLRNPDLPTGLYASVQLATTYMALDPSMAVHCLRIDYDIAGVYGLPSTEPLVNTSLGVATKVVMDIRNFWLRHLLDPNKGTFHTSYMSLPPYFRTLHLEKHPERKNWPDLIKGYAGRITHDGQPVYFRGTQTYHGSGGSRTGPVRGFIEEAQDSGISGVWWHICFISYERLPHLLLEDSSPFLANNKENIGGSAHFFKEVWPPTDFFSEFNSLHLYEGVLVPGGCLMLGRWSDLLLKEEGGVFESEGPFIYWNV
ncbi:hypothetical protein BJY04DRAFT_219887 [Aspergillus karnatakaensis]|uniref:uncharacterized protein n=1 Tax=Aspergillus karnatakaensis TaxID=1810916 RepID=UPI003CCE1DCA